MSRAHPLDPATAAEYLAGRDIMVAAGLLAEPVRFAYYGLEEAAKDAVLAGAPADRRLRAFLVNTGTGESTDVVVSLTGQEVVSARILDPAKDGQMPILESDFAAVDEITKADPAWRAAMARRGYHDVSTIRTAPITAGAYGAPFDAREGLTLHQVSVAGRPVLYRASIPEMVVPYGDPKFRYWQAYFDTGEYLVGTWANSLELGCDCLGEIAYLDATVTGDTGQPRTIANAICIHEEDFGILWKHTDIFNGSAQSRRQRRLVFSYFTTVGNYDYGFYWYFYLDGTIELEVKATGVLFTSAYPGGAHAHATEVAPGLAAPFHQHLFSARLDVSVDGQANAVEEVDVTGLPVGPDNPYGNAIVQQVTRLTRESQAGRRTDGSRGRTWRIISTERANRFGRPTSFTLYPEPSPALLADPDSPLAARAGFAANHLWVTRYDAEQRWPAGDFVNQNPGGAGLPAFVAGDHDIDGEDIVVWHTFGPTHVPRPEDWPVMPVARCGFVLKPTGFFDRNPTLDVPPPAAHC